MPSKKYQTVITQTGDNWTAQITRQVTSRKVHVSKEQSGFENEAAANEWAEQVLTEFVSTQKNANERQSGSRKLAEETKRNRSTRRAEKTEAAKLAKEEADNAEAMGDDGEE